MQNKLHKKITTEKHSNEDYNKNMERQVLMGRSLSYRHTKSAYDLARPDNRNKLLDMKLKLENIKQ